MSDSDEVTTITFKRNKITEIQPHEGEVPTDYDDEDDRAEKPWQQVPSILLILVIGVYILLAEITQLVENDMPAPVSYSDLRTNVNNSDIFSEESALIYLDRIVGSEPRVAGCPFHLTTTVNLKAMLDHIAADANQVVKTDWQIASGDFFRVAKTPHFSVYRNVSNIVALLEGESGFNADGTLGSSILVNCHYDSVPFALGASDNAAFCAIMAEALTKLSRSKTKLKRNIIFLFNGAEENGLQASHGFLQHPWAKGASVVINLDASGMNGKPALFQVTNPRVLDAYKRSAPKPNAQSIGAFLFSTGLIPSDTDFRIWNEYGGIHGVDMAFVKWANVYHTRNDKPELLLPGVLQGAGDMILALLKETANAEDFEVQIEQTAVIYYDYLNLFLVKYSLAMSHTIDMIITILGLVSVGYFVWVVGPRRSTVENLLITLVGRLAAAAVGSLVVTVCTKLMVATTVQLRYLPRAWIVAPLYWIPYYLAFVGTAHAFDARTLQRNGLSRSLRCLQAMSATRLIFSIILLILETQPQFALIKYLFSMPLLLMSVTSCISITAVRYVSLKGWQHLLLEICLSIPLVMFMFSMVLRLNAQMLPVSSRSSGSTPDYTVAILNAGLVVMASSTISGVELLFSQKRLRMVLSLLGAICALFMFMPLSPYDGEGIALQRHYWFNSEIVSYDINKTIISRSSGIIVSKLDPYSTSRAASALESAGFHFEKRENITEDCEKYVFCGLTLFRSRMSPYLKDSMYVYTDPPAPFTPHASVTADTRVCSGDECKYRFVFTGAHHNMITLWPRANVTVSRWSLHTAPRVCFTQLDRPVYVIYHSAATYNEQGVQFTLDVTLQVPPSLQSQPLLDLSHHSHKIYSPEDFTPEYKSVLNAMPSYFNVASFLSFRHDYVF